MSDTGEPVSKRLRHQKSTSVAGSSKPQQVAGKRVNNNEIPTKSMETDSSKSLLDLDDVCLQKLFARLNIESLSQMANVCKRFGPIAEQVFGQSHKKFVFKGISSKMSTFRRVIRKFGHLITSIDTSEAHFQSHQQIDFGIIVKYCSENLEELILDGVTINSDVAMPLFSRLKHLDLRMCDFTGNTKDLFSDCPNLEILGFEAKESCGFVAKHFPKLEGLSFDCSPPGFSTFFHLLALNPQLKLLQIMELPEDLYIEAVVKHTKNVEALIISPGLMSLTPEIQTKKGFLLLSKLKKLKRLNLYAGDKIYAKLIGPLVDAFAKGNVPINRLELRDFSIKSKDIQSILKLKAMQILSLDTVKDVSDTDLIALTTQLKELTNLHLYLDTAAKTKITINGLTKMIKNGKKLDYFALVSVKNLKIGKKAFESLLKAAQSRGHGEKLTIDIVGHNRTSSFIVPENIQRAGNAYLTIKFTYASDSESESE